MQKISTYLYSNRISVVADLASYPVEWKIVYQRRIKLYKGMKNVIEFDVRNADQKKIDILNFNIKCLILDVFNTEVLTKDVVPILSSPGLATMTIYAEDIDFIKPQFLKFTLYILNDDGTKTPLYGDSQFGINGQIEVLNGAVTESPEPKTITVFSYVNNDGLLNPTNKTYTSEAVEVNPRNDINENGSIGLEFYPKLLDAEVKVQITTEAVVHAFTSWTTLETFTITPSTDFLTKTYQEVDDYSNNIGWLRIVYNPTTANTGKFDKVIVRL
jgi:hypothetical protein